MRSEYHGIPPRTLLRLTPVAVLTLSDIRRISLVGLGYSDRIITAARRMIFRAIAFGRDRRGDVLFRLRDYGLQGFVEPGIGASKISYRQSWLTCRWLGNLAKASNSSGVSKAVPQSTAARNLCGHLVKRLDRELSGRVAARHAGDQRLRHICFP